jgi:hypothetical protein
MGEFVRRAREKRLAPADLTGQLYVDVTDRMTARREHIVVGGRSYTVGDLQRAMRKDDAR